MASTIWTGKKEFSAPGGSQTVVAIPAPARGVLRGYALVQLTGAAGSSTADLYTSQKTPENLYHLVSLSAAENNALSLAYHNQDGTPSLHQRYLYLRITPAGTGAKTFALSVTVETPRL
jgi:hypothetical protein